MDDIEYNKQIDRIDKIHNWWVKALGLMDWRISHVYKRTTGPEVSNNTYGVMECWCRWEYKNADITVYVAELADISDNELESIYIHELMHIYLDETKEKGDKHQERVATQLAQAFVWIRNEIRNEKLQTDS